MEESGASPFKVLGIALVVEERGKGARLVFRYPCQDDNLFFTLPPRAMAKIFRPKKPLCNQPMTVSVGGTVFCCRAILMNPEQNAKGSSALVLFSVIVALIPSVQTSSIAVSGWYAQDPNNDDDDNAQQLSASFLAVRQVHVSLARFCRVLEREEIRCRYVTLQSAHLHKIDTEFKAMKEKFSSDANNPTANKPPTEIGKGRHRRQRTFGSTVGASIVTEMAMDKENETAREEITKERQQVDQDVVDLMLASNVNTSQIHGNLARELLQVFHAMFRTNESIAQTPSAMVSARDSTVFINRHLAVPIESIHAPLLFLDTNLPVRPYHCLLFPLVSCEELADKLPADNSYMKQLLSKLHPSKSLTDIALEGTTPLQTVMEMATYLVHNGHCTVSHVLRKQTVLACLPDAISNMQKLSLQFSQIFKQLSIHCMVSVLTMGCTLEELVERLCLGETIDDRIVRAELRTLVSAVRDARDDERSNGRHEAQVENAVEVSQEMSLMATLNGNVKAEENHSPFVAAVSALEDYILGMATWLAAHKIVAPKQEYLIAGRFTFDSKNVSAATNQDHHNTKVNADGMAFGFEELLYKELSDEKVLNGKISSVALCFRHGLDERSVKRLRTWGLHSGKILRIFRVPNPGDDDWG